MNIKKIVGWVLQVPLYLLVLGSFGASIYAAAYKIQNISWTTPLIMGGLIVLFVIGAYLKQISQEPKREKQHIYANGYDEMPITNNNYQQ